MKLKEIRQIKNISQDQLSSAIGVKSSVISKYENGRVKIPKKRLEQIAAFLNVDINVITCSDDLVVKSDGEIITAGQYVSKRAAGEMSDGVYSELVALFNRYDDEWQRDTLLKLKLLTIDDPEKLSKIKDLLS